MTSDEVISMAHEAGTTFVTNQGISSATLEWLERFAKLVAAHSQLVIAPAHPTRDQIRAVFIEHGFSVKEGQKDLKEYVYEAANALLKLAPAAQPDNEPVANIREALEALVSNNEHAESGGIARHQKGSQTWQLWRDAEQALGITGDKQ